MTVRTAILAAALALALAPPAARAALAPPAARAALAPPAARAALAPPAARAALAPPATLALAPPPATVAPQPRAVADDSALIEIGPDDPPPPPPSPRPRALAPLPPPLPTPPPLADDEVVGCGRLVPACERLTIVGTVFGGLGLAAIAGAAGLLLTPDRVLADEPAYLRSSRRAGAPLLALGASFAVTGLLMVLTGARAANKRRLKVLARTPRLAL